MRKKIRCGAYELEILDERDSILSFRDIPAALSFLRRFKGDQLQMALLRRMVTAHAPVTHPPGDEEVIHKFAGLLVSGRIKVLRSFEAPRSTLGESVEQQAAPSAAPDTPIAPARRGWIEIRLHDCEGNPVAGKKYRITMPDGSVEDGTLDDFGHAEYNDIQTGTCMVAFPELDAEAWEHD